MVVKSSIVVPVIIVMWDLKFIVEVVVTELMCGKVVISYTVNNVVRS